MSLRHGQCQLKFEKYHHPPRNSIGKNVNKTNMGNLHPLHDTDLLIFWSILVQGILGKTAGPGFFSLTISLNYETKHGTKKTNK